MIKRNSLTLSPTFSKLLPMANRCRYIWSRIWGIGPARPASGICREKIEQALLARLAESPIVTLRMDIINKCNLRCIMCHYSDPVISRRRAESVTTEQFMNWFSPIAKYAREIMLSCGDEPLMSKHFPQILETASTLAPSADIGFCTNAMLMTSHIRLSIIRNKASFILFSIDGATPETFERIRVGSSYEKVFSHIKALKLLKDQVGNGKPRFILNFVMMRSNIHEAPAIVEIGKDLNVEWIDFRHAVPSPPYWNDETDMLAYEPDLFNFFRAQVVAKSAELKVSVVIPDPFPPGQGFTHPSPVDVDLSKYYSIQAKDDEISKAEIRSITSRDPPKPKFNAIDLPNEFFGTAYCERPFTEILIRNQREVLPCAWHKKVLGILDDNTTLSSIYLGNNFAELRLKMMRWEIDEGCLGCPIKSGHLPTRPAN